MKSHRKPGSLRLRFIGAVVAVTFGLLPAMQMSSVNAAWSGFVPNARGELDCNGQSPIQHPLKGSMLCTDIRGFASVDNANTWGGRFYDNGEYIGHDEPDMTFLSNAKGSGNNVTWNETLAKDPAALPTVDNPGHDVSHWFELSPAPWFSMAVCDPNSYPQTACTPDSDVNAPACGNLADCPKTPYPGGGGAFMEMQFYPSGNPPFVDSDSCDDAHWCAALTIDSLECTEGFAQCNRNCEEPVNFAFIQKNGIPDGAPSPQKSGLSTYIPNDQTLLMNPGDKVSVHMYDAPAPAPKGTKAKALEVVVKDLTTGQSGWMQASAANGFQNTSIVDCSGTPFNFEPEYSTAAKGNIIPWAALQTNISTEFETGHFEPCTSVSSPLAPNPADPLDTGGTYNVCAGPYETAGGPEGPESGDAFCYNAGDTHPGYAGVGSSTPPDEVTGCQDNWFQNGDLDFDSTAYWPEWPTSANVTGSLPSSFVQSLPRSAGRKYSQFFFQSDVALSESSCGSKHLTGCTVPPTGPGHFYPYWTEVTSKAGCTIEFGNVPARKGHRQTFGEDLQYGKNQFKKLSYPEFEGSLHNNTCPPSGGKKV